MKHLSSIILSLILLGLWGCSDNGSPVTNDCTEELDCANVCGGTATLDACSVCGGDGSTCNISFDNTVQPIFTASCTGCHGTSGGLTLTSYITLMQGDAVISGNGSASLLIQKLRGTAGDQMPLSGCCLEETLIQLIETWIDEGANNN